MPQIIVRDLDDDVRDRLRDRAKAHGRSMEAEAREILRTAVMSAANADGAGLGTRIARLFEGDGLDEPAPRWHGRSIGPVAPDERSSSTRTCRRS